MPLAAFILLQALDALTTLVFLRQGVQEGNPLIRVALASVREPAIALLVPKLFAVLLGVYAWRRERWRLLWRMNALFAVCVAWNVAAIYRSS